MLSGRSKTEYVKEAQAVAEAPDAAPDAHGATAENDLEAVDACVPLGDGAHPSSRRLATRCRR